MNSAGILNFGGFGKENLTQQNCNCKISHVQDRLNINESDDAIE